jgi:hypothetical protein
MAHRLPGLVSRAGTTFFHISGFDICYLLLGADRIEYMSHICDILFYLYAIIRDSLYRQ